MPIEFEQPPVDPYSYWRSRRYRAHWQPAEEGAFLHVYNPMAPERWTGTSMPAQAGHWSESVSPFADTLVLYDHVLAASYAPAFNLVRMYRVLPLFLYLEDDEAPTRASMVLTALTPLIEAAELVPVLEFPDQYGSFLKRMFLRTRRRRTGPEVDAIAQDVLNGLATGLRDSAPGPFEIRVAFSPRESESTRRDQRDAAAQGKDRAETAKFEAEAVKNRAEAAKAYAEAAKLLSQTIRNLFLTGTAVFWLVLDGQAVGGIATDEKHEPPPAVQEQLETPPEFVDRLLDVRTPEDFKALMQQAVRFRTSGTPAGAKGARPKQVRSKDKG